MQKFMIRAATTVAALAMAASASAATIVYTVAGSARGTLNGAAFNGAFSLTTTGDTATQAQCMNSGGPVPGCKFIINDTATVDIAGLGSFSLVNPSISFVNNAANLFGVSEILVGMPTVVNSFAFVNISPAPMVPAPSGAFAGWDGISNLGPISTNLQTLRFFAPFVATNGGPLVLNDGGPPSFVSQATFTATLQTAAVPEPASWLMMIAGFGFVGSMLRRARKASNSVTA